MNKTRMKSDESKRVDYGDPVDQPELIDMKDEIVYKIPTTNVHINHEYSDVTSDVTVLEDDEPILNVFVNNLKWDKNRSRLFNKNDYHHNVEEVKQLQQLPIPLYCCFTSKRIDQTVEFATLWINKNFKELYRLYPTKIQTINKRRNN